MDNYNQNASVKVCANCGGTISADSVFCTQCGARVGEVQYQQPQYQQAPPQYQQVPPQYQQPQYQQAPPVYQQPPIIIQNTNTVVSGGNQKSKWVALLLCFFLGLLGAHKFYEGKVGMGILYLFTAGLFGIGAFIDFWVILFKPSKYYV